VNESPVRPKYNENDKEIRVESTKDGSRPRVGITSLLWGNPSDNLLAPWLDEVRSLGYEGVSGFSDWGWQTHVADPSGLRKSLDGAGLDLASMIAPLDLNFDRYRRLFDLLNETGCENLIILGGFGREEAEFGLVIEMMSYLSSIASARNVRITYHNHTDNTGETFAQFCRITDGISAPRSVMVDVGHATKDFVDVEPSRRTTVVLDRYENDISMIELKDFTPETGLNTVLGEGLANLPAVAEKVAAMNYRGWLVVEQNGDATMRDNGSASRCARQSRTVVRNLFGI
jgi:sugar phosphate isomerase/epimerase